MIAMYQDAGGSGRIFGRKGYIDSVKAFGAKEFDIAIAEAIDWISRDWQAMRQLGAKASSGPARTTIPQSAS